MMTTAQPHPTSHDDIIRKFFREYEAIVARALAEPPEVDMDGLRA